MESPRRVDGSGQPPAGAPGAAAPGGPPTAPLTALTDAERASLAEAAREASPVALDGASVVPGAAALTPDSPSNEMPLSLLLVVAGLTLIGVGALSRPLWRARM